MLDDRSECQCREVDEAANDHNDADDEADKQAACGRMPADGGIDFFLRVSRQSPWPE